MADKAEWMSIGEAAKYIGVSRDTLRRWEKKGKVKPVRSPTNRRYFTKKHLDEVMAGKYEPEEKTASTAISKNKSKQKSSKKSKGMPTTIIFGVISFIITALIAAGVLFFLL